MYTDITENLHCTYSNICIQISIYVYRYWYMYTDIDIYIAHILICILHIYWYMYTDINICIQKLPFYYVYIGVGVTEQGTQGCTANALSAP